MVRKIILLLAVLGFIFTTNSAYARRTKENDISVPQEKGFGNRWTTVEPEALFRLGLIDIDLRSSTGYSWKIKEVFPAFKDAPPEVINEFVQRIQHLSLRSEQIYFEQQRVRDVLASIQGAEGNDQVKTLEYISYLINMAAVTKRLFYKELAALRNEHYEHHHEPMRFSYPRESVAILSLCEMTAILTELQKIIPQDSAGVVGDWRRKIDEILSRSELQPFLEQKDLLNSVLLGFISPEDVYKNNGFAKLVYELGEDIWTTSQDVGGGADKQPFLRQFPDGVMNNLLARIDYYCRAALMVAKDGAQFPSVDNPAGTIKISSYANPIAGIGITDNSSKPNPLSFYVTEEPDIVSEFLPNNTAKDDGSEVVPVDISIDSTSNVLLLSGPNMGGKTTTARGIALSVILTQMGLPIPADNPELAIFKNIYAVFPSTHQITPGFGYFSSTVKQITELIAKAKPGDLVILDEVPAGTEYRELVAIATVLTEDLIATGATVVVTGHLKKAFELIAKHTGQIPMRHTMTKQDGRMVPDYGLEPGIAGSSYAIEMTHDAGFPTEITELARLYYRIITEGEESVEIPEITPQPNNNSVGNEEKESPFLTRKEPEEREMVNRVVDNLYPLMRNFVLILKAQQNIKDTLSGHKSETDMYLEDLKGEASGTRIPVEAQERLAATQIFVDMGVEKIAQLKTIIKKFEGVVRERFFWSAVVDKETVQSGIAKAEELLGSLLACIEPAQGTPLTGEVIDRLSLRLKQMGEFRESFDSTGVFEIDAARLKELCRKWNDSWDGILADVFNGLLVLDLYSGMAIGVMQYGLKQPQYSENEHVFSLNESLPFVSENKPFSNNPFVENPVAESFSINSALPVVVVTGPNSSGKTVLNFNCWINALFAKYGFYVSGDLEISKFDNVFAFFGGRDRPLIGESYFRNLLGKYADILNKVTPNSLVILDELHGSDNFELAAIQLAVLHYLRAMNCTVIFNTHIRDGLKLLADKVGIDLWQTNVEFDETTNKIKPLYTLSPDPNLEAKSYGLAIARPYLTDEQISRVEEIIKMLEEGN